jgi:4-hydroxy-tetrahydrodipicolinate synthase
MFSGSLVALITPFTPGGDVDWKAFDSLVEWQIAEGTDGLIPVGTTGESPTLSHEEHKKVVERCVGIAKGTGVPVIAGAGSNSTAEAVDFTRHAKKAGADAALSVAPYYNKPTQEGLYRHFKAAAECDIPVIVYNIPGRSIVDISVETMTRLAKLPNIVGVKDATNDLTRPTLERASCGADFVLLSGEDATALAYLSQGGDGCISVTANIAPRLCAEMHDAWKAGDARKAQAIHFRLMPLHKALFIESSPGPVKYGAHLLAKGEPADASKKAVRAAMVSVGLLN